MNFSNFKKRPDILAGYSISDFINFNLFFCISTILLVGIQRLFVFPFIANKLGPQRFGSFVLFMTIVNIVIVVIPGCINLVIIRIHSLYNSQQKIDLIKNGLLINFSLSFLIVCIIFFIFPLITNYFKIDQTYRIFLVPILLYIIFYNIREGFLILKRIYLKFSEIAIYNIIFAILFVLIIPAYWFFKEKGLAICYMVIGLIATLIVLPRTSIILRGKIRLKYLRKFYMFSPSFAFVSIIELSLLPISRYIISYYENPTQVSYFFAATSIVQMLSFPFSQVRSVLLPFISQKKNLKEIRTKDINVILITSILVGILLFFLGLFLGKFMIIFLYGKDYYIYSKTALFILLIGQIFYILKMYLMNFIIIFFKRSLLTHNAVVMLLLNIIINFVGIPKYGIIASATGFSVSLIVSATWWYVALYRKVRNIKIRNSE